MITKFEKLILSLASLSGAEAASVEKLLAGIRAGGSPTLAAIGLERVDVSPGDFLTEDGREVSWTGDEAWALPKKIHDERRSALMMDAEKKAVSVKKAAKEKATRREGIAATTCPQMIGGQPCGGALNRAPVCPSCITGKLGYRNRYTCESCGFDIVTKTELAE